MDKKINVTLSKRIEFSLPPLLPPPAHHVSRSISWLLYVLRQLQLPLPLPQPTVTAGKKDFHIIAFFSSHNKRKSAKTRTEFAQINPRVI